MTKIVQNPQAPDSRLLTPDFWSSPTSEILINPRYSPEEQAHFAHILKCSHHLPGHVWIATSGSTAVSTTHTKWVALSKEALLISAHAVNTHLRSSSSDVWIHCLPDFHVGGLGIWARSHLTGAKVIDCKGIVAKWNPMAFYEKLTTYQGTLTSLVPTQLFDLLNLGLTAPQSLRAAIIGGSRLAESLYDKAKELGWPLLPSYGSTECASQVATAELGSNTPCLKILPHIHVRRDEEGHLWIKSDSLFTCYAVANGEKVIFINPKENGWFRTEDIGNVKEGILDIEGRTGRVVKVAGENVDLTKMEMLFDNLKMQLGVDDDIALVAVPDERLGHAIHLAVSGNSQTCEKSIQGFIEQFNALVMPYERIRKVHFLSSPLPRSPLFKLLHRELLGTVQQ
jgi:o-succinylbenzoate---CoA ligase